MTPMPLRSPERFTSALWNFASFDGVWGGRRRPSDIDMSLSIGDEVLVVEFKPEWSALTRGQALLLEAWARKGIAVYVVVGGPDTPTAFVRVPKWDEKVPCDLASLRAEFWLWRIVAEGALGDIEVMAS